MKILLMYWMILESHRHTCFILKIMKDFVDTERNICALCSVKNITGIFEHSDSLDSP